MRRENAEISKRNPYYISRERYMELRHFCLQYKEWKHALGQLNGWEATRNDAGGIVPGNVPADPTERQAILRAYYSERMRMVEQCAEKTERVIAPYLLKAVTEDLAYQHLQAKGVPCGRQVYYTLYRKFFWLLSKERG